MKHVGDDLGVSFFTPSSLMLFLYSSITVLMLFPLDCWGIGRSNDVLQFSIYLNILRQRDVVRFGNLDNLLL